MQEKATPSSSYSYSHHPSLEDDASSTTTDVVLVPSLLELLQNGHRKEYSNNKNGSYYPMAMMGDTQRSPDNKSIDEILDQVLEIVGTEEDDDGLFLSPSIRGSRKKTFSTKPKQ